MEFDHVHFYVHDAHQWQHWFTHVLGFRGRSPLSDTSSSAAPLSSFQPPVRSPSSPIGASATVSQPPRSTESDNPPVTTLKVANGPVQFYLSSVRAPSTSTLMPPGSFTPPSTNRSTASHPVTEYLKQHPPGVADVAFRVRHLDAVIERVLAAGGRLLSPPHHKSPGPRSVRQATVSGWGNLRHTLIETVGTVSRAEASIARSQASSPPVQTSDQASRFLSPPLHPHGTPTTIAFNAIDHVVINVSVGEMVVAADWYCRAFGFQHRQRFEIQTPRSALRSQVLTHPEGQVQLPINEPASAGSQIQEFLEVNRGAGVQHIALHTPAIVNTISHLRRRGLEFLSVPMTYYEQLRRRPGFCASQADWRAIAQQQILADWHDDRSDTLLLQAFTQPIFSLPTFFFEIIQRHLYRNRRGLHYTEGFGEGNFRALFEAIEREQIKRGHLVSD